MLHTITRTLSGSNLIPAEVSWHGARLCVRTVRTCVYGYVIGQNQPGKVLCHERILIRINTGKLKWVLFFWDQGGIEPQGFL